MKLEEATVFTLFGLDQQFEIPLFQRQYVWDKPYHWKPMWDDLEKLSDSSGKRSTHFIGTIVVKKRALSGNLPKIEIIDGQQRLTTFQIILCAIRDVCKSKKYNDFAEDVRSYTLNLRSRPKGDEKYKLIPGALDRDSFMSLIDQREADSQGQIKEAYNYFKPKIEAHVMSDPRKIELLFNSLLYGFNLAQIFIDEDDEPEKIFESLNTRSAELLQFDLLRNNLFLRSGDQKDHYYNRYWDHFETLYWATKSWVVKNQHTSGTTYEPFLQHFLMAKTREETVKPEFHTYQRVYLEELQEIPGCDIEHEFSELKRYSEVYREMIDCDDSSEIGNRMIFYKTFNLTILHPFILFLILDVKISGDELNKVFDILESYTIRRMLCFNGTRGLLRFNIFFSHDLIGRYKKHDFTLDDFIEQLSKQEIRSTRAATNNEIETVLHPRYEEDYSLDNDYIVFPNNMRVRNALEKSWVVTAGAVQLKLIKYILYRIEDRKRHKNPNMENVTFRSSLTLEHIMPKAWRGKWKLPTSKGAITYSETDGNYRIWVNKETGSDGCLYKNLFSDDYKASNPGWMDNPSKEGLADPSYLDAYNLASVRDHYLDSIGNLTLVTASLNKGLATKVFSEKRDILAASRLILNKEICEHDMWNVNEIHARAERLISDVCEIWKPLEAFRETQ